MEVSIGKSPLNGQFSIAMFDCRRVSPEFPGLRMTFLHAVDLPEVLKTQGSDSDAAGSRLGDDCVGAIFLQFHFLFMDVCGACHCCICINICIYIYIGRVALNRITLYNFHHLVIW